MILSTTSDHPRFFETVKIPNLGSFQDGGLKRNNPVRLALWESRLLWPSIPRPDLVLSLGTGTDMNRNVDPPVFKNFLIDGFLPRTYRWLKAVFDGEDEWRNLLNDTDTRYRDSLMRMNIAVPEESMALDNLNSMESLSQEVLVQYQTRRDDLCICISMLVSRLFFVLETAPELTAQGFYHCRGTIRCRLPGPGLAQVARKLDIGPCTLVLGEEVLENTDWESDVCKACHRYRKKVEFFVRDLEEPISMAVHNKSFHRTLSSFPQCINWFVRQQGLDAHFGSKDGRAARSGFACSVCSLAGNHSRKRQASVVTKPKAKRQKNFSGHNII